MTNQGIVEAVCISDKKGVRKDKIEKGELLENFGLKDDAHGGDWHRQVSLLAIESIKKMQDLGLEVDCGDFGENIVTKGVSLTEIPLESKIFVGDEIILKVTQIGKECHDRCAIYYQAGDCIMPREGIFAEVINGGTVKKGDHLKVERNGQSGE